MPVIEYYQGTFVTPGSSQVPLEERGHQFGDGVYEVIRVYGGRVFLLDWHLERLERSLRVLGMESPMSASEWTSLIGEAVRQCGESEAQVYLQVTRGIAPRAHVFNDSEPAVSLVVRTASAPVRPEHAKLLALPDERWANAYVKSINLLPNVIAKETARRNGAIEALYVRQGWVLEGAGSNVWFVRDGKLLTAPANRYILGGVTRRFVLQLAGECGFQVDEEALSLDELSTVDEVFITSTTQEIQPITEITVLPAIENALRHLPEETPQCLVGSLAEQKSMWHYNPESHVTKTLGNAFANAIERFRNHEEVAITN